MFRSGRHLPGQGPEDEPRWHTVRALIRIGMVLLVIALAVWLVLSVD